MENTNIINKTQDLKMILNNMNHIVCEGCPYEDNECKKQCDDVIEKLNKMYIKEV